MFSCAITPFACSQPCVSSRRFLHAQEVKHPPSVAQCQGDQKLWLSMLEQPKGGGVANVNFDELEGWFNEMHDCQTVDPENERRYFNTTSEITTRQWIRLFNFLHRNNLWGPVHRRRRTRQALGVPEESSISKGKPMNVAWALLIIGAALSFAGGLAGAYFGGYLRKTEER